MGLVFWIIEASSVRPEEGDDEEGKDLDDVNDKKRFDDGDGGSKRLKKKRYSAMVVLTSRQMVDRQSHHDKGTDTEMIN